MKTHKKLRYERLIFVIVSILLLGFGISKIIAKPDPYKELKEVSEENKKAGELISQFDEENEQQIRLFHYPQFESKEMNAKINEYVKALPKENGIALLDYESDELNQRYLSVVFHYQLMDVEKNVIKEEKQCISYDTEAKRDIKVTDVFRRDYYDMLREQFKKQANTTVKSLADIKVTPYENTVKLYYKNAAIQ